MIVVKSWHKWVGGNRYEYKGWFIFGFIPLYIVRT